LFNLKRKVKNKACVEALIYKAYIVEYILTFIPYYFELHLRTRIKCVSRHDDDGGSAFEWEFVSIFSSWMTYTKKYNKRKILDRN